MYYEDLQMSCNLAVKGAFRIVLKRRELRAPSYTIIPNLLS